MEDLKDAIKLVMGLIAVASGVWAYLHLLAFLKERGTRLDGNRVRVSCRPCTGQVIDGIDGTAKFSSEFCGCKKSVMLRRIVGVWFHVRLQSIRDKSPRM